MPVMPVETVNTFTTQTQSAPDITALEGGGWAIAWQSSIEPDGAGGTNYGIRMQIYAADGSKIAGELLANSLTSGDQVQPSITGLEGGGFLVTWADLGDGTTGFQLFDAAGMAIGGQQILGGTTPVSAIARAGGGFTLTYEDQYGDRDVVVQNFGALGQSVSEPTIVSLADIGNQYQPLIAALDDGGSVVVWNSDNGLFCRIIAADGSTDGDDILLNITTSASGANDVHVTGLADGGFLVTWETPDLGSPDFTEIMAKRYNADGAEDGDAFQINSISARRQLDPSVTALADGGWVLTWSERMVGDDYRILQSVYDADGNIVVDEMQISVPNQSGTSPRIESEVTALEDGGWVVTWQHYKPNANAGDIVMRRFEADGQIYGTNDAPVGADQTLNLAEDATHTFTAGDFGFDDSDGNILKSILVTSVGDGTLTLDGTAVAVGQEINASDMAGLTWAAGANGNGSFDAFEFKVIDDGGTEGEGLDTSSDAYTMSFEVASVADTPTGADATITVTEDTTFTFAVSTFGYADDDDDDLAFVKVSALPPGLLLLDGVVVTAGQEIAADDLGDLTWTPPLNEQGDDYATLVFKVIDDSASSNISAEDFTLTFDVTDVVDLFTGKRKADNLRGTDGVDILDGKGGNDKLTGRDGADTFIFAKGYDRDTINDFEAGGETQDLIDVSRFKGIDNIRDLKPLMEAHGNQVTIDFGGGDELVIRGVTIRELGKADFLL
ncbi:MAG: hypothetical protein JWL86_6889 [Rhizobium sp.]|nr:hypothetical protein [Rhizobium sp.]